MIRHRQQLHYSDGCSCNSGPPGGADAFLQPRNVPQPSQEKTVDSQGWRRIMLVMPKGHARRAKLGTRGAALGTANV